jgi:DNA-binding transcriptional LysR family regulator
MLLREVEVFVQVARSGGVSEAARVLAISQPAATSRLRSLERELGVSLFERSNRGMELSAAGRVFLPFAERILVATQDALKFVREYRAGEASPLVIGCSGYASTHHLAGYLTRLRSVLPEARTVIRTGHSEDVAEWVLRREVEVGIVRQVRHPDLAWAPLVRDALVLVVSPLHPFAERRDVSAAEVGAAGLIQFARHPAFVELAQNLFDGTGVTPSVNEGADTVEGAKVLVEAGFGVGALPRLSVARELGRKALISLHVPGLRNVHVEIVAIWHARGDSTRAQRFLEAIGVLWPEERQAGLPFRVPRRAAE